MILTNKEAWKKWCHVVFANAHTDDDSDRCIASECMAWRWEWYDEDDPNEHSEMGFCGLAGNPWGSSTGNAAPETPKTRMKLPLKAKGKKAAS